MSTKFHQDIVVSKLREWFALQQTDIRIHGHMDTRTYGRPILIPPVMLYVLHGVGNVSKCAFAIYGLNYYTLCKDINISICINAYHSQIISRKFEFLI